jgi:eukaryotic-like serine/threonine-protein kinase
MDFVMQVQSRYTILGEIASGSTATVFLAEDLVLRRKVALKKLHPHLLSHSEVVNRFEKEAVAVASLSHENIIKVYDFGRDEHGLFLAMEYVDGKSLEMLLSELGGCLPSLVTLTIFRQLMEGLAAAHTCGIYHRDIKPSNLLIDTKGCVRIADFGIAFLAAETSITKTGSYLGTPGYSAPEQAEGKAVTDKTDIFASGILFYRCLTGQLPFQGATPHAVLMAIMESTPIKANQVNRRIIPGMSELVQEMLAKSPEARPSAGACLKRLEEISEGLGFPLNASRISRLMQKPFAYLEKENQEVSERFLQQARLVEKIGKNREAMKLYSMAELFAEINSDVAQEASKVISKRKTLERKRRLTGFALTFLVFILVGVSAFKQQKFLQSTKYEADSILLAVKPERVALPIAPKVEEHRVEKQMFETVKIEPQKSMAANTPNGFENSLIKKQLIPAKLKTQTPNSVISSNLQGDTTPGSKTNPVSPIALGFLALKTNPPFAKILIDGRELGQTPLSEPLVIESGDHILDLVREGCKPIRSEIKIIAGEIVSLRYSLERVEAAP